MTWPTHGASVSLQSTLRYGVSHGFQFEANYTWSKALTLSDAGATTPVNGLDAKGSYGPANFDRQHVFSARYVYELPFGTGKPWLGNMGWFSKEALGGWQVSGITVLETGIPFQITATDTSNTGGVHTQVANRSCNGNLASDQKTILQMVRDFDASRSSRRQGDSGIRARNPLWGPGTVNFDLSAFKKFPFWREALGAIPDRFLRRFQSSAVCDRRLRKPSPRRPMAK